MDSSQGDRGSPSASSLIRLIAGTSVWRSPISSSAVEKTITFEKRELEDSLWLDGTPSQQGKVIASG